MLSQILSVLGALLEITQLDQALKAKKLSLPTLLLQTKMLFQVPKHQSFGAVLSMNCKSIQKVSYYVSILAPRVKLDLLR